MHHAANAREDPRIRNLANRRVCANLFLQQMLYYGTLYSVSWVIFWCIWIINMYGWKSIFFKDEDIVRTVFMVLFCFFEPIRLIAGWYGNLQENVPWLILYVILTFVPLHVIVYYIMMNGGDMGPLSKSVQYVQAGITELQFFAGIYTLIVMYRRQKQQFYLFEYVMNQRRRNDDYLLEGPRRGVSQGSGSGGIGSHGQRR